MHRSGSSEYFETAERTAALIETLERFTQGLETTRALQAWARDLWEKDGTQAGPLRTNKLATMILTNLWSADARQDPEDRQSGGMLRVQDALEYLRVLRTGAAYFAPRDVASVALPLGHWAARFVLQPTRHVIDGLGWFEFIKFASSATGRTFLMRSSLPSEKESPCHSTVSTELQGDAGQCLQDLLETLAIDRRDLTWVAHEFEKLVLPEWVLWRQDDNGIKAEIERFTGYKKALSALADLEAKQHKQAYWLENPHTPA